MWRAAALDGWGCSAVPREISSSGVSEKVVSGVVNGWIVEFWWCYAFPLFLMSAALEARPFWLVVYSGVVLDEM